MEARIDFIEELLEESAIAEEKQQIEMNRLRADQLLNAVEILESGMAEVNQLADDEIKLIESYRSNELARLDKQRSWLTFNLEQFARSTGKKTIRLPHGILRLRKGRDRVAIISVETFLPVGEKLGLMKTIPENTIPDTTKILSYMKRTKETPPGTEFIPAGSKFSYSTNRDKEDETEQSQT